MLLGRVSFAWMLPSSRQQRYTKTPSALVPHDDNDQQYRYSIGSLGVLKSILNDDEEDLILEEKEEQFQKDWTLFDNNEEEFDNTHANAQDNNTAETPAVDVGFDKAKISVRHVQVFQNCSAHLTWTDGNPTDKFYMLQLLSCQMATTNTTECVILTRWGHQGTRGATRIRGPLSYLPAEAQLLFEGTFKDKVGVPWSHATVGAAPLPGKYQYQGHDTTMTTVSSAPTSSSSTQNRTTDTAPQLTRTEKFSIDSPVLETVTSATTLANESSNRNTTTTTPVISVTNATDVRVAPVDPAASATLQQEGWVHGEFDATLNLAEIGQNNNKFYKLQVIYVPHEGSYVFSRWGRVGTSGSVQELGPMNCTDAVKEFEKKFRAKTGNKFAERHNFTLQKGKYALVEIAAGDSNSEPGGTATQGHDDLIAYEDVTESELNLLDTDQLPLGTLSHQQIQKGFAILEQLDRELDDGTADNHTLTDLSSQFYTTIPHSFGRNRGPVLNTKTMIQTKCDMLNTLADMEATQEMQRLCDD